MSEQIPDWARTYDVGSYPPVGITADIVGFALTPDGRELEMLAITRGSPPFAGQHAFPGGYVEAHQDPDLRATAIRELREETGMEPPTYLETLDTYDSFGRDPRQFAPRGARVFSKSQLALFRRGEFGAEPRPGEGEDASAAHWARVYGHLPWEDLRAPKGLVLARSTAARLRDWAGSDPERGVRVRRAWGEAPDDWNEEGVPERWALLQEAGLVEEAWRDRWGEVGDHPGEALPLGDPLAFDHRRMLADGLGRLRGTMKSVPAVLHALLYHEFTLAELQTACEAIGGRPLRSSSFRQTVARSRSFRLVEPLGRKAAGDPAHRAGTGAKLFAFRSELVETVRLNPAIRMPWQSLTGDGAA